MGLGHDLALSLLENVKGRQQGSMRAAREWRGARSDEPSRKALPLLDTLGEHARDS